MAGSSSWDLNLEQGEWFEENVARPWLLKNRPAAWITDSRNHKRRGGKGPRLVRGTQEMVLPDFRLDDPATGSSSWLDSKVKMRPFTIPGHPGERFFSLDPRTYRGYVELMGVFHRMPFEILMGCAYTNIIWLFDLRSIVPVMHEFNNEHVRNGARLTPCFSTSQMKIVGKWDSTDLPR